VNPPVSRSEVCAKCGTDVRCCKNCVYYAPGVHYDCRETVEELVADKERANFCDSFTCAARMPHQSDPANGDVTDKAEKARKDFAGLFGG
jgi:hypothetical protein